MTIQGKGIDASMGENTGTGNKKGAGSQYRICFLSALHPPLDKRVFEKEAATLAAEGFDVIHLAPGNDQPVRVRGVQVETFQSKPGLLGRVTRVPRLYRLAARIDADCYHCNEMDSWTVGVLLKIFRRKKIVFDVHEHYPSTFGDTHLPKWLHPVAAACIRLWIRAQIPFTDAAVLAKGSVASDYKSARRILLVQNFTLLRPPLQRPPLQDRDGRIWAVHVGVIGRGRGWPQMLEALAKTRENIGLRIIGTFNDGSQLDFEQRASTLGLTDRITVEDWLPFDQLMQRLALSDIGLVLFQPGIRNHVMASPHKIFDYMQASLPVIAPDFAVEVAEVVRESGCGILVNPASPDEIARALDRLAGDTDERTRMGQGGRKAVEERFNWQVESGKLVEFYREMSFSGRQQEVEAAC